MKAEFGIKREQNNHLFYKEYRNDKGVFHFHSQIELYFVDDGEMEICVNSYKKTVKKGEMSISLSYDAHSYKTPEASESSVLIIPTYLCEEFINKIKGKRNVNPFITDKEVVKKIKECISVINTNKENDILLLGYIYVILGIIMENISFKEGGKQLDKELSSKILFFINENFRKNITVLSISKELGYNPSYLSRYFKSCFNIGINQYLGIIRLKNALMLMHEKKHNMTYCALESGFNSMRTFYRAFHNEFNCSPKEYMHEL